MKMDGLQPSPFASIDAARYLSHAITTELSGWRTGRVPVSCAEHEISLEKSGVLPCSSDLLHALKLAQAVDTGNSGALRAPGELKQQKDSAESGATSLSQKSDAADRKAETKENNETGFSTPEAAGRGSLKEIWSSSQLQHKEYSSTIYKDRSTGKYHYTEPACFPGPGEPGYNPNLDPAVASPVVAPPRGMEFVADAHTHVSPDAGFGMKSIYGELNTSIKILTPNSGLQEDANNFSERDDVKHKHRMRFLGTPDGRILEYDPRKDKTFPLGRIAD